jgi:hypothetical protein
VHGALLGTVGFVSGRLGGIGLGVDLLLLAAVLSRYWVRMDRWGTAPVMKVWNLSALRHLSASRLTGGFVSRGLHYAPHSCYRLATAGSLSGVHPCLYMAIAVIRMTTIEAMSCIEDSTYLLF